MQAETVDANPRLQQLRQCVQVFDDAMTPAFCAQLIDSFNSLQPMHVPNGRGLVAGLEGSDGGHVHRGCRVF